MPFSKGNKIMKRLIPTILTVFIIVFITGCSCTNRGPVSDAAVTAAADPVSEGSSSPTAEPTLSPSEDPAPVPDTDSGSDPSASLTESPDTVTVTPAEDPGSSAASEPTSALPTADATPFPTAFPTSEVTPAPTALPTAAPTSVPTPTPVPKPPKETDPAKSGIACPSVNGALKVIGTQLSDESGNPVQLRGVSTHGLAWFPAYVNKELFKEIRNSWNANVIRLAMYTDEYGGYCSGGDKNKLKKLIKDGVQYATEADLYVIVDWHILNDQDPNKYISDAKDFFREMSAEFSSHNNVIYEICNEPNGGTTWQSIKSYAEVIIPIIRANDPDAVIIVGTPNWSQYVDKAADDPITGQSNIMYALHFYAATHKDDLRTKMKNATAKGLPIFVTEYGICDASGNGSIDTASAGKWVQQMDSLGISYVCWNLSNKNETSALIISSCSKTSGFTLDDMSSEGKWLLELLKGTPGTRDSDTTPTPSAGGDSKPSEGIFPSSGTSGEFSYELTLSNSWESEGKTFYQYDLTVINNQKTSTDSWKLVITAKADLAVSNIWCASASVSGNTITVSNESYNGTVAPGEKLTGAGFIVYTK